MVALVHAVHRNLYCGATIISNRYALTAAHCMINRDASETGLLVGTHDRRIGMCKEFEIFKLYWLRNCDFLKFLFSLLSNSV